MRKVQAAIAVVGLVVFMVGAAGFRAGATSTGSPDRMTVSDLRHAVVPAYCDMPRQRLHHNKTARRYLPRQGWMDLDRPGQPIAAHLQPGRRNLVATYSCTAGGVGWPQVVVAYSPRGRLIDALRLFHYSHQEHADVRRWRAVDHRIRMHWVSYEGAGFDIHRHHSWITLHRGQLALHRIR